MPIRPVSVEDLRKLQVPVKIAEERPRIRGEFGANVDDRTFQKIREMVELYTRAVRPNMYSFWAEIYRDREFLDGIARLLWHTDTWGKQGDNILGLLAIQQGSMTEAALAMRRKGGLFNGAEDLFKEAVTVARGSRWESDEIGTKRIRYSTRLGKKRSAQPVEFDIALTVFSSSIRQNVVDGANIDVRPRQWVDNVYRLGDANVGISYNGEPLRCERRFDWLPVPGTERQFKASSFHARLALTPLRSSYLSVAIYKGGIHTLFIHPIGLR